jgi:hypothetical protein
MLRRPKCSKNEVVALKEEEEVWLLRSGKELTQVIGVETRPLVPLHRLRWASIPFIIPSNKRRTRESRGDNIWE